MSGKEGIVVALEIPFAIDYVEKQVVEGNSVVSKLS